MEIRVKEILILKILSYVRNRSRNWNQYRSWNRTKEIRSQNLSWNRNHAKTALFLNTWLTLYICIFTLYGSNKKNRQIQEVDVI